MPFSTHSSICQVQLEAVLILNLSFSFIFEKQGGDQPRVIDLFSPFISAPVKYIASPISSNKMYLSFFSGWVPISSSRGCAVLVSSWPHINLKRSSSYVYNTPKVLLVYKLHLLFQGNKRNDKCMLCSITFLFMKGKTKYSKTFTSTSRISYKPFKNSK